MPGFELRGRQRERDVLERLLAAAERLSSLDPAAARAAYLTAVGAALHAGRLGGDDLRRELSAALPGG